MILHLLCENLVPLVLAIFSSQAPQTCEPAAQPAPLCESGREVAGFADQAALQATPSIFSWNLSGNGEVAPQDVLVRIVTPSDDLRSWQLRAEASPGLELTCEDAPGASCVVDAWGVESHGAVRTLSNYIRVRPAPGADLSQAGTVRLTTRENPGLTQEIQIVPLQAERTAPQGSYTVKAWAQSESPKAEPRDYLHANLRLWVDEDFYFLEDPSGLLIPSGFLVWKGQVGATLATPWSVGIDGDPRQRVLSLDPARFEPLTNIIRLRAQIQLGHMVQAWQLVANVVEDLPLKRCRAGASCNAAESHCHVGTGVCVPLARGFGSTTARFDGQTTQENRSWDDPALTSLTSALNADRQSSISAIAPSPYTDFRRFQRVKAATLPPNYGRLACQAYFEPTLAARGWHLRRGKIDQGVFSCATIFDQIPGVADAHIPCLDFENAVMAGNSMPDCRKFEHEVTSSSDKVEQEKGAKRIRCRPGTDFDSKNFPWTVDHPNFGKTRVNVKLCALDGGHDTTGPAATATRLATGASEVVGWWSHLGLTTGASAIEQMRAGDRCAREIGQAFELLAERPNADLGPNCGAILENLQSLRNAVDDALEFRGDGGDVLPARLEVWSSLLRFLTQNSRLLRGFIHDVPKETLPVEVLDLAENAVSPEDLLATSVKMVGILIRQEQYLRAIVQSRSRRGGPVNPWRLSSAFFMVDSLSQAAINALEAGHDSLRDACGGIQEKAVLKRRALAVEALNMMTAIDMASMDSLSTSTMTQEEELQRDPLVFVARESAHAGIQTLVQGLSAHIPCTLDAADVTVPLYIRGAYKEPDAAASSRYWSNKAEIALAEMKDKQVEKLRAEFVALTQQARDTTSRKDILRQDNAQRWQQLCGLTDEKFLEIFKTPEEARKIVSHCFIAQKPTCSSVTRIEDLAPECLQGTLGTSVGQFLGEMGTLKSAEARLKERVEAVALTKTFCDDSAAYHSQSQAARVEFTRYIQGLQRQRDGAMRRSQELNLEAQKALIPNKVDHGIRFASNVAGAAGGLAGAAGAGAAAGAVAAMFEAGTASSLMETAEHDVNLLLATIGQSQDEAACQHQAQLVLKQIPPALAEMEASEMRVRIAKQAILVQIKILVSSLRVLALAESRLDELAYYHQHGYSAIRAAVNRYVRLHQEAKRSIRLAQRAREFETQGGYIPRSSGLTMVDSLEALIENNADIRRHMDDELAFGAHRRGFLDFHLKESLLGVASLRQSDANERFRAEVSAPGRARYASDGTYLGQAFKFSLAEAFKNRSTCDERLTRVWAIVHREGSQESLLTRIKLRRSTESFNHWCSSQSKLGTVNSMTYVSLHESGHGQGHEVDWSFSDGMQEALFEAMVNKPEDFTPVGHEDWIQSSFFGQGLFGDYELILPPSGPVERGPMIEKLTDVVVRFDFTHRKKNRF